MAGPDWGLVFAERHAALLDRVTKLEEQRAADVKAAKELSFEWDNWYEKFRTLYARLAKRVKDAERREPDQDPPESREDAPRATIPPLPLPGERRW